MREQIRDAEDAERRAERKLAEIKNTTEFVKKVRQMVFEITGEQHLYLWSLEEALGVALGNKPAYDVEHTIRKIETELKLLKETLGVE